MKPTPVIRNGPSVLLALVAGIAMGPATSGPALGEESRKVDPLVELMFPSTPGVPYYAYPAVDISSTSPFNLGTAPRTAPSAVNISSTSPFTFGQGGGESRSSTIVNQQVNSFTPGPQAPVTHDEAQASGSQQSPGRANISHQAGSSRGAGTKTQGTAAPSKVAPAADQQPISLAEQNSLIHFGMTAGYYSHYMFRGLDVGYRTGIDANNSSAFAGASASLTVGNFALGAWYMNSLDSYVPGGAGIDGSFGHLTRSGSTLSYNNPLDYRTPARVRYQEYDLFANYTFKLTKDLFITPGMNFYFFNDGRFWQNEIGKPVNSTVEAAVSLTYTGIPHLVQNLNYYYDFEAFKGGYLEYKVATKPITLYKGRNGFAVGLVPSVTVGYDFRYNGPNNGWNHIEPGIDIPISISDGLTLNLGVRDSMDLGSRYTGAKGKQSDRTDDRFYFFASLNFAFPNGVSGVAIAPSGSGKDGKVLSSAVVFRDPPGPWRVAAGAGVRSINADFSVRPASSYNIMSLVHRRQGGGELGLADGNSTVHYKDGAVYGGRGTRWYLGESPMGTNNFAFSNKSQLSGSGTLVDGNYRQITFSSDRYSYSQQSLLHKGFNSSDDDQPVYPYVNFSRELGHWKRVALSVGLGYSYTNSSTDSGMRLTGLQTASEGHDQHFFTYGMDEVYNTQSGPNAPYDGSGQHNYSASNYYTVITNSTNYQNTIQGAFSNSVVPPANPQHNKYSTLQEVARVGVFRGAKLETDLHTVSLPLDLSIALSNRVQFRLSFGPTVNFFNNDIQTDTYYQELTPSSVVKTSGSLKINRPGAPYRTTTGKTFTSAFDGPPDNSSDGATVATASGATTLIAQNSNTGAVGAVGNGKGSNEGRSRGLPGKTLKHTVNHSNESHVSWGVFGQAAFEFDLDQNKHWFLETFARYDYVGKFGVSDGASAATIDASSWGAGIGLGYRF